MAGERRVRELLNLRERDRLQERGVFPPPDADELAPPIPAPELARDTVLTAEWLDDHTLAHLFSDDPVIAAVLPGGRVKRLDVEPRIVVFEDVPEGTSVTGAVIRAADGSLIMDARVGPAALTFPAADHEVVLLGEQGDLRVFVLRRSG